MPAQDKVSPPALPRYEGLDSFRVVGIYVIVLFHFQFEWGRQASLGKLESLRGCAFPVVILTSFFVVSRSVLKKRDRAFREFLAARFMRIEIPFLLWTAVYWGLFGGAYPLRLGGATSWPSPALLVGGYMHLWFLQFIFLGSIILYPLLLFFAGRERWRWRLVLSCLLVALSYAVWVRPLVAPLTKVRMADADVSLWVFLSQANNYFAYIPVALAFALCAEQVQSFYARRSCRILSLMAVAATMWIHVVNERLPFTKGLYSLAVFVALLQPVPAAVTNALRPIAMYSYPVYILHFLVSHLVAYKIFYRARIEVTPGNVLLGSIAVFGLSLLAGVLLRKMIPRDWFLPLIPISRRTRGAGPAARPAAYALPRQADS